jgi:hypothetical protein
LRNILVLAALATLARGAAHAAAPYPRSRLVTGVAWDTATHRFAGRGGDLWATTSAAGGLVYTAWGDGTVTCPVYVSYGVAALAGGPGAGLRKVGCGPPGYKHGKLVSLLDVAGTLSALAYLRERPALGAVAVWSSPDHGKTWRKPAWAFPAGALKPVVFAQFGPGYAGARDRYAYLLAARPDRPGALYLMRAPWDRLQVEAAYEYLTGPAASPGWGPSPAAASPVFADRNGADAPFLVYDAGIGRYLLTAAHGREDGGRMGLFEGPEPWGPWSTVDYRDGWLGIGSAGSNYQGVSFPSAWTGNGGTTLWAVFSCWSRTGACGAYNDGYNLMRARLTLAR